MRVPAFAAAVGATSLLIVFLNLSEYFDEDGKPNPWQLDVLAALGLGSLVWAAAAGVWIAFSRARLPGLHYARWPGGLATAGLLVWALDVSWVVLLFVAGAHVVYVGLDSVTGRHLQHPPRSRIEAA